MSSKTHWDKVWDRNADDEVSWYQSVTEPSLTFIQEAIEDGARSVIDVGGGTSLLVDQLIEEELDRLAVLDISAAALDRTRERLGALADHVKLIAADIREIPDLGPYDVWHDRALFHFLTDRRERELYLELLNKTVSPRGRAIIATFGPDGPEVCSGLEVVRYDEAALARVIGPGFELLETQIVNHVTPRGWRQQFLYAVFVRDAASAQRAAST
jgi:SAM-dependent methyltransferase